MKSRLHILVGALVLCVIAPAVHAVPSFARQTGLVCVTFHVSWPELTSVGRHR